MRCGRTARRREIIACVEFHRVGQSLINFRPHQETSFLLAFTDLENFVTIRRADCKARFKDCMVSNLCMTS